LPADEELTTVRRNVGSSHVRLDPASRSIAFDRQGVELDLGGIAKGYAVDRAVQILREGRVSAALVSAGGSTIYGLGAPPDREAWDVLIADPGDADRGVKSVRLKGRALSVAGRSEKSFEVGGVTYSHIMDPRTGRPVQGMLSVAVLTDTGTAGDALDDALFVMGVERSRAYLNRLPGTEAFFFLPDKDRWKIIHLP
jgi:FAD:protein FMN transferase